MRCIAASDTGTVATLDAGNVDASACPSWRSCGATCCSEGESCGTGDVCCAAADLCGGTCCGGEGVQCVADTCVLDCGASAPCGTGATAACCEGEDVCLLDTCTTPGAACAGPFDCDATSYCEVSIGRCLPRATGLPECEYRPPVSDTFELDVEWHWSGDAEVLPTHNQVMSAAMVANLTDDNGDGRIDENDTPDVVFNTFAGSAYTTNGILRAVNGNDGSRIWPTVDPGYRTQPSFEVAIADVRPESPGPEIIGCTFDTGSTTVSRLTIFSATGAILHRFDTSVVAPCGRPGVADMNGDGVAEIVVGSAIVQADGSGMVTAMTAGSAIGTMYDVNGDGDLELIGINGVANHDGTVLWQVPLWAGQGGYVAVADVDLDGDPDIVATNTTTHQIAVRDGATGELLAGPIEITPIEDPVIAARVDAIRAGNPTRDPLTGGGPPTIANFDADPEPEIAMAGGYAYVIFERDLTRKWYEITQDTSSRATGSSVFDFEGDGIAEVLYNDELLFRAFRGPTGDVYLERCNTSGTLTEYPIVVDVDNDDHAEIILVGNNYAFRNCADGSPSGTGVWSFGHPRAQWVRTRRIWNEHAYHVTNINEDGTLPLREAPNFSSPGLNNFRQNVQPDGLFNAPDLVLRDLVNVCREAMILRARVTNQGRAGAPAGIPVSFYIDGAFVGRAVTLRPLLPGASEVVEVPFSDYVSNTTYTLTARINDAEHEPIIGLNECRETNNDIGPTSAFCTGIE